MTTNRELERILKDYSGMDFCGDTACSNYQACLEAIKEIKAHFHQALSLGLPERNDMKHAVNAHSDAGAGHVIGFNYCLEQVTQLINQVFNKER